jgi:uncharacterized repeat protein (TIGR02543 family)
MKGQDDAIIVKFNEGGDIAWVKNYGGSSYEEFYSVVAAKDGGYVAVGYTGSTNGDLSYTHGGGDFLIAKFDQNGEKQWMKNFGGSLYDDLMDVTKAPGGGYVAAGISSSNDGDLAGHKGANDAVIFKFTENGNKVWMKNFGGSQNDAFFSITQATGGGFLAVGGSESIDGDIPGNRDVQDAIIMKFDKNGKKKWTGCFGGNDYDEFLGVIKAPGGGYTAVGHFRSSDGNFSNNKGGEDFIIAKFLEKYKVSFKVNKGKKLSKSKRTKMVSVGAKSGKLPKVKRTGYKFKGWYTKKKGGKKITAKSIVLITKNTPLYAQWKKKK